MPRVTQKLLANRLKFAAEAMGMRVATSYNDVGGLQLGQAYGGVQVEIVTSEGGGISTIGPRMRATDMADALQIVSELAYFKKKSAPLENPRGRKNPPSRVADSLRESEARMLETLIDVSSLNAVVATLSAIAQGKADFIRENWQDKPLAKTWEQDAKVLITAATKVRN